VAVWVDSRRGVRRRALHERLSVLTNTLARLCLRCPGKAGSDQPANYALRHSVKQCTYPERLQIESLGMRPDDAQTQVAACRRRHGLAVSSVGQIDARLDPLTGQWECVAL
jgi:hypothetical protein